MIEDGLGMSVILNLWIAEERWLGPGYPYPEDRFRTACLRTKQAGAIEHLVDDDNVCTLSWPGGPWSTRPVRVSHASLPIDSDRLRIADVIILRHVYGECTEQFLKKIEFETPGSLLSIRPAEIPDNFVLETITLSW